MTSIATQIIKPRFNLSKLSKRDNILNEIVTEVKKIVHLTYPTCIELIEYIGTLIENLVIKRDAIDKKQIFIDILKIVFPSITDEEINISVQAIEYLLNTKAIKKIPLLKYALHLSRELIGSFLKKGQVK